MPNKNIISRTIVSLFIVIFAGLGAYLAKGSHAASLGPTNTVAPAIAWNISETSGDLHQGETVNVNDSNIGVWDTGGASWSGTPFTYQWLRDCNPSTPIAGETEPLYTFHSTDVGHTVCVAVTAHDADGVSSVNSNTVGPIVAVSGATTHYIADNGSDSNSGTSESAPWKHVPGMAGCASNCVSYTPNPGDQFILKGGDTWDDNGSQGVQGLPWHWGAGGSDAGLDCGGSPLVCSSSGTQTARIYVGVDRSWHSGASWTRPLLSGDNAIPGAGQTHPSSCTINDGGTFENGSGSGADGAYVTFDGLEVSGFCQQDQPVSSGCMAVPNCPSTTLVGMGIGDHWKFLNWYVHGWSNTGIMGQNLSLFQGYGQNNNPKNPDMEDELAFNIIDGSDSSGQSGSAVIGNCWALNHNFISFVTNSVCQLGTVNDNTFQHVNEDGTCGLTPSDHGNTLEEGASNAERVFYNNVVRNIGQDYPDGCGIGVNLWFESDQTMYVYNNVMYNTDAAGNYDNWDQSTVGAFYNNTFLQDNVGDFIVNNGGSGTHITTTNNHFIGSGSSTPQLFLNSNGATGVSNNDLLETNPQATTAGYTAANQYAPTSSSSPTVGKGINESSLCSSAPGLRSVTGLPPGLPDFCRATTGAVEEASDHTIIAPALYPIPRPSSGVWDQGAYQYTAGSGASTPVTGDLNNDGHVNIFDLSIFLSHWQQSGTGLPEDFNNDDIVNIFDLSVLLSHYGT